MKTQQYYLFTKRNIINNNDSNKIYNLMIKGGLIRKLSSGIYIWLPNGLKIINNINKIIKRYMNKLNGIEIYIPILQNSTFLKKSNRYILYGKELFKLYNRYNKLFILSPTNEEIITNIICNEIKNNFYPKFYYQIQSKFRDEIRPRYNILRSIEFIMKEGYSFHSSKKCLDKFYEDMLLVYKNIFFDIGIDFFYKEAKCGNIGGVLSHEFHINSYYGDNKIYYNKYINNILNYNLYYKNKINKNNFRKIKLFNISKYLLKNKIENIININFFVKTVLIKIYTNKYSYFMFILIPYRKKIDINKLYNIFPFIINIKILKKKYINKKFNINNIFICPFGYFYQIIADYSLLSWKNFIFGSNFKNSIYYNVNFLKNINVSGFFNICKNNSYFIRKKKNIKKKYKCNSIELAHTFKLMDYYYNIFSNKNIFLDKKIYMGCYGIGVTRLIFSIIEKYNDNNSIILPLSISHFKIGLIPIDMYNNFNVYKMSFKIYDFLLFNKIDVLFDNRKLYVGNMLTDFDFIGIPNILIISNKMLSLNLIEFKDRLNNNIKYINKYDIFNFLLIKYKKLFF